MRETRQSGSEGGVRLIPHPYPYPIAPIIIGDWYKTTRLKLHGIFAADLGINFRQGFHGARQFFIREIH
jgi:hypothetical protein